MQNRNWTYSNNRYYWGALMFMIVLVIGAEAFIFVKLLDVFTIGLQRHFSKQYDFVIPLIFIVQIVFVASIFIWSWKVRFNDLNPSFRMNEEMMEIDRAKKVRFCWKDVTEVVITDRVEFVGFLSNIERQAVIFKLPQNKQEFVVIGKGIYIQNFEEFYKLIQEYVPQENITYNNITHINEYKAWLKTRPAQNGNG